MKKNLLIILILFWGLSMSQPNQVNAQSGEETTRFAVVGDFGSTGDNEMNVANLVKSWSPDFIVTVGDNNYPVGGADTIDANIGQYYAEYIYPYTGSYGSSSEPNRFFPALGNHDWYTNTAQPFYDYFTLPNNERYYDFIKGPVHFFVLNSNTGEPDGITPNSTQGQWLKSNLANSTAPWRLVVLHHAPFSSSLHGSNTSTQWQFANWGANAVMAGHDHSYERIQRNQITYFVNGLGGMSIYPFYTPVTGSKVQYDEKYGAMLVTASRSQIRFQFINTDGQIIDDYIRIDPYGLMRNETGYNISFNGWKTIRDASAYRGSYIASSKSGRNITFTTPDSRSVSLISYRGPNQGIAAIYIDGILKGQVDFYSPTNIYQFKKIFTNLPYQKHTVRIVVSGIKNELSSGQQIRVDAIQSDALLTDNTSRLIRYDSWIGAASAKAQGGAYRHSSTANASVSFRANSRTVRIITARGPSYGKAQIKIDGNLVKTVDLYSPTQEWKYMVLVSGLADGWHNIEWIVTGSKNPASSNTKIVFDGIR